jgi:hypothetical protein
MSHPIGIAYDRKHEDRSSGLLIKVICFTIFLPVAALARLTGWRWKPWPPGPSGYGSIISETRSMARVVAGIAVSV